MTFEQLVFVMEQRVQLLRRALHMGFIQEAGYQLDRLDYLADRLQHGVPYSVPDREEKEHDRRANRPSYFPPNWEPNTIDSTLV
jgi:hypothetical protein